MRLAPIPIYYHRDLAALIHYAGESSKTTHGTAMCVDSCMLFAQLIHRAFSANSKQEIFENLPTVYSKKLDPIIDLSFTKERYDDIKGSGFVIESIIAALWCFWHANDFREAILLAANLGDDADTTAAVCGQIAGAYWGYDSIPQDWREALTMEDEIKNLTIKLIHNAG
jgi:ADP-ribosyl-[dinitrogen reductase] hydrolase